MEFLYPTGVFAWGTDGVHLCTEAGLRPTVFGAASLTVSLIGTWAATTLTNERKKEAKASYLTRQMEKLTGGAVRIELQTAAA